MILETQCFAFYQNWYIQMPVALLGDELFGASTLILML